MTARVLVVDDILPNVKLLEARLTAEYFDVVSATSGREAIEIAREGRCDVVLLDVMMPGMDGFEVCRRLKADPLTLHVPVVMVTALDEPADRVRGLMAGADDFLTKPVDEIAVIARVRSLSRLKVMLDELRERVTTSATLGLKEAAEAMGAETGAPGRILLVEDRPGLAETLVGALKELHQVDVETDAQAALIRLAEGDYDLAIIGLDLSGFDALRLCSQLRSLERTRALPVLIAAQPEGRARILRGLDLGVNDYILRPIDRNELVARVRTQLRRKRYADALRENMQQALELAVVDALTGLNNRRFLESHLASAIDRAAHAGRPLSLMLVDVDHFKSVNDGHGHDAGDEVLRTLAQRIRRVVRNADLVCRLGGEEFVIVMPDTPLPVAARIAERVRDAVQSTPFKIDAPVGLLPVTVSIGLAERAADANADALMRRADKALYDSKAAGRNRVTLAAA
ncbi:PleD family two-component system response regulator [Methylocystis bryophila]|uniref:diguanylate cyclase n=1 Tax=Methylocystis bryophila TaxID=655015 RepID=A0A1W6MZK1_9HYPH|nr:PleD family two-component system response regulator [Methylocystis bryophila]ARN82983.1 PleD family two-component system response regulator [Methylocystis bryophila]BDV39278.1 PleD family two-component system response regulator [Methylocystis bryophila]